MGLLDTASSVPFSPLGLVDAGETAFQDGDPAAGLDEWAGGLDEFAGSDSGQSGYGPDDTEALLDASAGQYDEAASRGAVDRVIDTVWSGHDGDTVDVLGPTVFGTEGSVWDVLEQRAGEQTGAAEWKTRLLLLGGLALVVLYLVRPLLEAGAALVDDGGGE